MRTLLLSFLMLCGGAIGAVAQTCTAGFTTTAGPGAYDITFTNTSTVGGPSMPSPTISYDYISFGDGAYSTFPMGTSITHTYSGPGSYFVYYGFMATDTVGGVVTFCDDSLTAMVTVAPEPCDVSMMASGTGMTHTFTATSLAGTPGLTYTWDFGDGTTGTGTPVTHTYTTTGYYLVTLTASSGALGCSDVDTLSVWTAAPPSCAGASASFTAAPYASIPGYIEFTPTSTAPAPGMSTSLTWIYGDGSAPVTTPVFAPALHYYSTSGTYTATLVQSWFGSGMTCIDSFSMPITVTAPSVISGYVVTDSTGFGGTDTFRVYLIQYDSASTLLTAIDSTIAVSYGTGYAPYGFMGHPAGSYRTKAALLNGTSGISYVPTYHDSSALWSSATVINHTGGTTLNKMIYMLESPTAFTGPGFVGGSVLAGANRGTAEGDPVAGQLVLLRHATSGKVMASAYTNASGAYSFNSVPLGSYQVYPELMNYATTPISVTLTSSNAVDNNNTFSKNDGDMEILPRTTSLGKDVAIGRFALAPNPTTGTATLKVPSSATGSVVVTSVTGAQVLNQELNGSSVLLDLRPLQSGFYFVTLRTADGAYTEKLLLQR